MKIFVAGATGVLGRRAVSQFVAAGAEVTGVARTQEKAVELRDLGATPVEVSLFDPDGLTAAIAGHEVVCNLATAIPTGDRVATRSAWNANHAIRRDGARNLVDAAIHAGADRYIQESISFVYADGADEYLDESAPVDPTWITQSALAAEGEAARFAGHGGAGVALRFGVFYGPDSAHTIEAIGAARSGLFPIPGPAGAYMSSVTTDDAASAVVAALGAPSGVYNVADRPLRRSELAAALSEALGTAPLRLSAEGADLPEDFAMMLRSQRVTSQLFATLTGWQPRFPSAWEGWRFVVDELRQRPVA
ncbi:MAG TPA: NAD(P)-dependent oxidoreductase [Mycobacteriales bacterium]